LDFGFRASYCPGHFFLFAFAEPTLEPSDHLVFTFLPDAERPFAGFFATLRFLAVREIFAETLAFFRLVGKEFGLVAVAFFWVFSGFFFISLLSAFVRE